MTFTNGTLLGRLTLAKIHCGSVWYPDPAVNVVTTISSKLRANARMPPDTSAERTSGKVTNLNVWTPWAPRSADASSRFGDDRRSRATTLL